jgi:DNA gyrase subunit A
MLVNGASGIAVGMATNIPPHNLTEVCDAVVHLIDHPDAVVEELMTHIPGPDFPTRATIHGRSGIIDAYTTGQGRAIMQARADVEELRGGRKQIVVTELPFQVNKAALVEKIAHLVRDKKIEGISDIRDESDRHGLRMVVELRREAEEEIVLNNLYKHTALRSSFNVIMLALVDGQPQVLDLRRALQLYIVHRQDVITRRSEHQLKVARERAHIVEGLRLALGRLEEVIAIIRGSEDAASARQNLMQSLDLSEPQSQAILDMQLRRLAALEQERLEREYQDLLKTIGQLEALLADPKKVLAVIRDDTQKLKKRFGDARRTEIFDEEPTDKLREEMIQHQEVVITLSKAGYIKRIPSATYKLQHRGGKGVRGMTTRDDDDLHELVVADTHDSLLFFTNKGRVYLRRGFDIQGDTSRTTRGIPLVNLVPLAEKERVNAMVAVGDMASDCTLVLATTKGEVKALRLGQLKNMRQNGLNAMDLEEGDELVSVRAAKDTDDVMIVTKQGQAIRFQLEELPRRSRQAGGVRGIRLAKGDRVVSMEVVEDGEMLLVVTSGGYGKLVHISRDGSKGFRHQLRGGMGTRTFRTGPKTGLVVAARVVGDGHGEEVMLVSKEGQLIRISVEDISVQGRITQGVILWSSKERNEGDEVASVACF